MSRIRRIFSMFASLVFLGACGVGLYFLLATARQALLANTEFEKALLAAVLAVISLVGGKLLEQRVKIRDDVRQRKAPIYEKQLDIMFTFLSASKDKSLEQKTDEIVSALRAATAKILIWGGPEVIRTWTAFRLHAWPEDTAGGFVKFERFIKAVRKELGNSNRSLAHGDLLKLFVNDFDEVTARASAALGSLPVSTLDPSPLDNSATPNESVIDRQRS